MNIWGRDWRIGFDCAHSGDRRPFDLDSTWETYRDMAYVTSELINAVNRL